jgi:hypothetical protein
MKQDFAKKMWPIMKAYAEGKTIQTKTKESDVWGDFPEPNFDSENLEYRIKLKPKFVPFTFEDNLVGKVIVRKRFSSREMITVQTSSDVRNDSMPISYKELLELYVFSDGSPCGKME